MTGLYLYRVVLLPQVSRNHPCMARRRTIDGDLGQILSPFVLVLLHLTLVIYRHYTSPNPRLVRSSPMPPVLTSENSRIIIPQPSSRTEGPQYTKRDDREGKNTSENAPDDCHWIQAEGMALLRI